MDPEKAADEMMRKISDHPLASTSVPASTTLEFYEALLVQLQISIDALREDIGDDS